MHRHNTIRPRISSPFPFPFHFVRHNATHRQRLNLYYFRASQHHNAIAIGLTTKFLIEASRDLQMARRYYPKLSSPVSTADFVAIANLERRGLFERCTRLLSEYQLEYERQRDAKKSASGDGVCDGEDDFYLVLGQVGSQPRSVPFHVLSALKLNPNHEVRRTVRTRIDIATDPVCRHLRRFRFRGSSSSHESTSAQTKRI